MIIELQTCKQPSLPQSLHIQSITPLTMMNTAVLLKALLVTATTVSAM